MMKIMIMMKRMMIMKGGREGTPGGGAGAGRGSSAGPRWAADCSAKWRSNYWNCFGTLTVNHSARSLSVSGTHVGEGRPRTLMRVAPHEGGPLSFST